MKTFLMVFLITCVVVFALFFATTQPTEGQKATEDAATGVQRGLVTPQEHEFSREYTKLYSFRHASKFGDVIEENDREGKSGDISGSLGEHEGFFMPDTPEPKMSALLATLSCAADAIVVGSAKGKASHVTEDETFIYTQYEFTVERILKDNPSSPIASGGSIDVTRPGGIIKLDGHLIKIEERSYEPLQKGMKYLLFLKFLAPANGYLPSGSQGDFALNDNSFRKLATQPLPKDSATISDNQKLQNSIREGALKPCEPATTGSKQKKSARVTPAILRFLGFMLGITTEHPQNLFLSSRPSQS